MPKLDAYKIDNNKIDGPSLSNIKSIQRGSIVPWNDTVTLTKAITITSIIPNNSYVNVWYNPVGTIATTFVTDAVITNSTTITLARANAVNAASSEVIYWEVIEFNNVKSKQSGLLAGGSSSITITSINPSKSIVVVTLFAVDTTNTINRAMVGFALLATNLVFDRIDNNLWAQWQIIEFN